MAMVINVIIKTIKINDILYFIMILNLFEYQYNFIFISLWVPKYKKFEWNWKKIFSEEGGGYLIMAMATDACWVGHFCVKPGIFVSNHVFVSNWAFVCRTVLFVSKNCYNSYSTIAFPHDKVKTLYMMWLMRNTCRILSYDRVQGNVSLHLVGSPE